MKKMKGLLTICLACLLTVYACVSLTSCSKTKEECIPKTLGTEEGLYLYYDNYRSFTDGSNTERLLNNITVDGVTYTTDEYYIEQINYMTNKKEIFYSLITQKENEEEKYFLWHYNYDAKESGLLREFAYPVYLQTSEVYLFARSRNYTTNKYEESVLYDGNLNFVQDGLQNYNLYDDMLYSYTETSNVFDWWKNGQFFSVDAIGGKLAHSKVLFAGKYAYLFPDYYVYAIDLDTGEHKRTSFEKGELFLDGTTDYGARGQSGEDTYFITYTTTIETEYQNLPLSAGCYLWKLRGLETIRYYAFPEEYEVRFSSYCSEKYINFDTVSVPKWFNSEKKRRYRGAYYDVEKDKFVYGKNRSIAPTKENFRIGEYEFYVDIETYGALFSPDYCYYLHRVKNGKDEILQYYFEEDDQRDLNPILFDDIHTK